MVEVIRQNDVRSVYEWLKCEKRFLKRLLCLSYAWCKNKEVSNSKIAHVTRTLNFKEMRRNIEKEFKYILEKLSKSVEKRWKICEKRVHIGKRRGAALRKLY